MTLWGDRRGTVVPTTELIPDLRSLLNVRFDSLPVRPAEPAQVTKAAHRTHRVRPDQVLPANPHLVAGKQVVRREDPGPMGQQELDHAQ